MSPQPPFTDVPNAIEEIRAGRMDPSGEGMVQAGRVLGMISTILMVSLAGTICVFVGFIMMMNRR